MTLYRVLYTDSANMGRFEDIEADSPAHAAWNVCRELESRLAELEFVMEKPLDIPPASG